MHIHIKLWLTHFSVFNMMSEFFLMLGTTLSLVWFTAMWLGLTDCLMLLSEPETRDLLHLRYLAMLRDRLWWVWFAIFLPMMGLISSMAVLTFLQWRGPETA